MTDSAEGHDKSYCGAKKRQGPGHCHRPAGWGTNHAGTGKCKLHGGSSPMHVRAAEKALAAEAVATYGLPITIDPRDALLEEVYRTAGAVAWLEQKVREISSDDLVWGKTKESDQQATEFPGTNIEYEAKPNIWLVLFQQERKHMVDVCKVAIAAGIEERRVRIAEQMGSQLAAVIKAVLDDLKLTPEQSARVPEVVPRHLRAAG